MLDVLVQGKPDDTIYKTLSAANDTAFQRSFSFGHATFPILLVSAEAEGQVDTQISLVPAPRIRPSTFSMLGWMS